MNLQRSLMSVCLAATLVTMTSVGYGAPPPTNIIYVDADGPTPGGWGKVMTELQDALHGATAGTEIWVAEGTYRPYTSIGTEEDRDATFSIPQGVELYGGFSGTETARNQRDPVAHPTWLVGGESGGFWGNMYHVVMIVNARDVVLDGFTIAYGRASLYCVGGTCAEQSENYGSAIFVDGCDPEIANCTLLDNESDSAEGCGGALHIRGEGHPTLTNCTFDGNSGSAIRVGVVIQGNSGDLTATNCNFIGNTAMMGGALSLPFGSATMERCWFQHNHAQFGGALSLSYTGASALAECVLTDCVFVQNRGDRPSPSSYGGAVALHGVGNSRLQATRCSFLANICEEGGAMIIEQGVADIDDCVFVYNTTNNWDGAALRIWGKDTHVTVRNCTITRNSGGAAVSAASGTLEVYNSILWGNYRENEADQLIVNDGVSATVKYNLIQACDEFLDNGDNYEGNFDADPQFVRVPPRTHATMHSGESVPGLLDVGGWFPVDCGDIHLLPKSPAIDSGMLRPGGAEDIDGEPRDKAIDIGADEYVSSTPLDLIASMPQQDESLWRSPTLVDIADGVYMDTNVLRLSFDEPVYPLISMSMLSQIQIQKLEKGGNYGPDLFSRCFPISFEDPNTMLVKSLGVLENHTWYAIRHKPVPGIALELLPFHEIHVLVQIGDANNDGRTLPSDLSLIKTDLPNFYAAPDSRLDITGDGMVLPNDLSAANAFIPAFSVAKPSGH